MALPTESLEHYRRILTALRGDLTVDASRAGSEVAGQTEPDPVDQGDLAVAGTAKDELLEQAERDSARLAQIDAALRRIDAGAYGTCGVCGKDIPKARLEAVPWAILCIEDQEIEYRASSTPMGGAPSRVA